MILLALPKNEQNVVFSKLEFVTVAAGILQKAGLITYKRGALTIEDRNLLENCFVRMLRGVDPNK